MSDTNNTTFTADSFMEVLAQKAGVEILKENVKITRKGIFIKGGDELGLLLEAVETHWPNQKYWARTDCLWLLPR